MMQLLQHPAHGHVDAEDIGDMAINIRTTFCFVIQLLISTALFFRLLWKKNQPTLFHLYEYSTYVLSLN